jgi:hypothetical protein
MAEKEYRRLSRPRLRRRGLLTVASTRSSLWLGKDHLLNIDSNRFTEEYKRFYFRDIQAITIRKTKRREIWNFALLMLLIGWIAMVINELSSAGPAIDPAMGTLLGALFLILAVPLLANNVLGPSCAVYLQTAVQIEELPSLSRMRRARKVLDRIRPLIVAAQGQLTPEEVSIRIRGMIQPQEGTAEASPAPGSPVVPRPLDISAYPVDNPGAPAEAGVEPR